MRGRTMERLDRQECIRLMEGHPTGVGRVALAGPRPVIFPVNYAVDRGNVVFRTDPGTKFHARGQQGLRRFRGRLGRADVADGLECRGARPGPPRHRS